MQSGAFANPQGKSSAVGDKWSDIERDPISRNEFLMMTKQNDQSESPSAWLPGFGHVRTESNALAHRSHQAWSCLSNIATSKPTVQPPPGLSAPPGLELPAIHKSENKPLSVKQLAEQLAECIDQKQQKKTKPKKQPVDKPEKFQVLLQNLPPMMLNESMLRAMLDQAELTDVMQVAYRQNGKALITFGTYASLCQCIEHFQDLQWGGASKAPVTATYVRLVKMEHTFTVKDVPKQPAALTRLSADASVFVPGSFAPAASLQPAADKMCERRDRMCSNTSTEPGSSDGMSDSDMEKPGPVACA